MLLMLLIFCAATVTAVAEDETAEWTVLFYICGSDLESKYAYASGNLQEIASCKSGAFEEEEFKEIVRERWGESQITPNLKINVLVETGGSLAWHAQDLGMNISTHALQRWSYDCYPKEPGSGGFTLEATLPLASMARPETLTDFIRWSAEKYPAKKYAIVLWGHGNGSVTGLFVDDLHNNDVMYLDELGKAMRNGGIHFETVVFDACMMANLETAVAVQDSASWMVASEELVAGKGTAVEGWLQQMINVPNCDGEMVGRWVCDMTQIKYANEDNESTRELMTWSVIDLSKINTVAEYFDMSYASIRDVFVKSPQLAVLMVNSAYSTEQYGDNKHMWDLSGVLHQHNHAVLLNPEHRVKDIKALMDAVPYCVRGSGRAAARGLSFCYAANLDEDELDVYARNYTKPYYLSFLDAISPWTAPDWVYEQVSRLPEMSTMDAYKVKVNKIVFDDGTPAISLVPGYDLNVNNVCYTLYRKNPRNGRIVSLGTAPAYYDKKSRDVNFYRAYKLWLWPSIDGEPCHIEALTFPVDDVYNLLYNIPIQLNSQVWNLRSAYIHKANSYNVYGLWKGYDSDSTLFNRNVRSLSQVAGQEFRLLYPIDSVSARKGGATYEYSAPLNMYRSLEVKDTAIQEGTYYVEYAIYDVFMRTMTLPRVEVYWDGKKLKVTGDNWEGQETLDLMDYYNKVR